MNELSKKIDWALKVLSEAAADTSWKDPHDPNYDRQVAEDALYHTIGPLTDTPRWSNSWTSRSEPVPGFTPGGQAPSWTPEEVVMAFAGDPSLLFKSKDNPKSPAYGRGGAPLYRKAKEIARQYGRDKDKNFFEETFGNGYLGLLKKMKPGLDEGRSPFISYAIREVEGTMRHGVGSSYGLDDAKDERITRANEDLQRAVLSNNPREVRDIIGGIGAAFRSKQSNEENPANPYGKFSSRIYQTLSNYADALESNDEDRIDGARYQAQQLLETIAGDTSAIRGASTGIGQAISTADRVSSIGVVSADEPTGEKGATISASLEAPGDAEKLFDPESVKYILQIALDYDLGATVGSSPRIRELAKEFKAGVNSAGDPIIGGKLTAAEYRYILRSLGPLVGPDYPGNGVVRSALNIPREQAGWWSQNEDPEIEPIPTGGRWNSKWKREGCQQMGSTEMSQEMTTEVDELTRLGIKTARQVKSKVRGEKVVREAVSKTAVNTALNSAMLKFRIIAKIHQEDIGLGESVDGQARPILEGLDKVDRAIIVETCHEMIRRIYRSYIS